MTTEILTLQSDIRREQAAVKLGFGDMIRLARLELRLKKLVDAESEEREQAWEDYQESARRLWPDLRKEQWPYNGWVSMGMDETVAECERRVAQAEYWMEDR